MKLAASNIGWQAGKDDEVLRFMAERGFAGLEIAPTRLFPERPYVALSDAAEYARTVKAKYGLRICSMQSIWYGMTQKIIESGDSRRELLVYTEKALCFADAVACRNLVFGCPRNRIYEKPEDIPVLEDFLLHCADLAEKHGAVIALEANPPIYHTNYLNKTAQALELIKRLDHPALKLNLDFGTVVENGEDLDWIPEDGSLINHVHISEPNLVQIEKRPEHIKLLKLLGSIGYSGFISIEMGAKGDIFEAADYLGGAYEKAVYATGEEK